MESIEVSWSKIQSHASIWGVKRLGWRPKSRLTSLSRGKKSLESGHLMRQSSSDKIRANRRMAFLNGAKQSRNWGSWTPAHGQLRIHHLPRPPKRLFNSGDRRLVFNCSFNPKTMELLTSNSDSKKWLFATIDGAYLQFSPKVIGCFGLPGQETLRTIILGHLL